MRKKAQMVLLPALGRVTSQKCLWVDFFCDLLDSPIVVLRQLGEVEANVLVEEEFTRMIIVFCFRFFFSKRKITNKNNSLWLIPPQKQTNYSCFEERHLMITRTVRNKEQKTSTKISSWCNG